MLGITYHCDIARGEYVGVAKGLEPFLALTWGLFCPEKKKKKITAAAVTGDNRAFHGREPGAGLAKSESVGGLHHCTRRTAKRSRCCAVLPSSERATKELWKGLLRLPKLVLVMRLVASEIIMRKVGGGSVSAWLWELYHCLFSV